MPQIIPHSKPSINSKDINSVKKVLRSGQLAQGREVKEFEQRLRGFIGAKGAVATNSGTAALHLALCALGITKGDEVIVPTFVCTAILNAINYTGAKPRLVDVNANDFNISLEDAQKKINKNTKAIIIVHMFGQPVNLKPFLKLRVPIIEDCAQALGATYGGQYVGALGKISICSFYATKLMTTAEGGMVLSNQQSLFNRVRDLRDYDEKNNYIIRYNYKMSNIQAALGISQLSKLKSFIKKRKQLAAIYHQCIDHPDIKLPYSSKNQDHIYFRYVIQVKKNRDKLLRTLKSKGIQCAVPVYKPLHHYLKKSGFPCAEKLMKQSLSLPIYPVMTKKQGYYIAKSLNDFVSVLK